MQTIESLAVEYKDLHQVRIPVWSLMAKFGMTYTEAVKEAEYYNSELRRMEQQRKHKKVN